MLGFKPGNLPPKSVSLTGGPLCLSASRRSGGQRAERAGRHAQSMAERGLGPRPWQVLLLFQVQEETELSPVSPGLQVRCPGIEWQPCVLSSVPKQRDRFCISGGSLARDRAGPLSSRRQESGAARGCEAHVLWAISWGAPDLGGWHCLEGHSELPGLRLGVSLGVCVCVGGRAFLCSCH